MQERSSTSRLGVWPAASPLLLSVAQVPAAAQTASGTAPGSVRDAQGAAGVGVKLHARSAGRS